jgi:hypothetical protein
VITLSLRANEAQFYVTMSRARRAIYLFTDSKTAVKEVGPVAPHFGYQLWR